MNGKLPVAEANRTSNMEKSKEQISQFDERDFERVIVCEALQKKFESIQKTHVVK